MPKIDLTPYVGRERAYVKHYLLQKYLPELGYRVGRDWDAIAYIDGFAGPWQTNEPNFADSSFGVAINALRPCQFGLQNSHGRKVHMTSILVEQDNDAYSKLRQFAERESTTDFEVHALHGEFVQTIPAIDELLHTSKLDPFRFVFLDPKGWAQIPMHRLQQFLDHRSCEVLINLMTSHIVRFLNEPDRAESYNHLFGRGEVLDILRQTPKEQRTEVAVQEYCESLRLLCGFKYVSRAVILNPTAERISYFLVFATNHPRGVEVFKTAELTAASVQNHVRHEANIRKTGQPNLRFDDAPPSSPLSIEIQQGYIDKAQDEVLRFLSEQVAGAEMPYEDILCKAMAFPLVTPDDLVRWLRALSPYVELRLLSTARRKPNPLRGDRIAIVNPAAVRQTGQATLRRV